MSSYVVLARKWRPQRFEDLTGQEHVARTLCNAIEQGRTPHAMLFTGARGVGKTTTARLVAMALNCVDGPTPTPCGTCDSCRQIQVSQSVDVLEIDGASNRGINEIRELREGVRYAPSRDRSKVYIIDEVHMLTTEAFNALLKTLEEPPPHVVFVFATTEAQKIPVTILSRCQRFDFRRIPHNEIVGRLTHISAEEGLEVDAEVLGIVARQAAGGMRDALSLLDQVIAFSGTSIRLEDAETILGAAERRRLFELSRAVIDRDVEAALRVVDAVDAFGVDMVHFATEFVAHLRDLSIVAAARDPSGLVMLTDGELKDARVQVQCTDVATLHRMFEIMVDSGENIARSNHPKLLFEMVLIRLTAIEPVHSLARLAEKLEALAGGNTLPPPGGAGPSSSSSNSSGSPSPPQASGSTSTPSSSADSAASDSAAADSAAADSAASDSAASDSAASDSAASDSAASDSAAPSAGAAPSPGSASATGASTSSAAVPVEEPTPPAPARPAPMDSPPPWDVISTSEPEPAAEPLAQEAESVEPDPDVASALVEVSAMLAGGVTPFSPDVWRQTVGTLRKEQPHAGELIASAYAVPTKSGVKLGLEPALVERVDRSVLDRLNAICSELGGGSHDFSVATLESLEGPTTNGYSVVAVEREERVERQNAADAYVRSHAATSLLLARFPGSEIQRVTIPEARQET